MHAISSIHVARALHNVLVNVIIERALRTCAPLATGRLLDIGCGTKPYAGIFAPYTDEHVGVDHPSSLHEDCEVDLSSSAYDIPVADGSFDTVLCTAVLEHLEEPAAAIAEARRVLRDGGNAIYIVPMIWHLHEEPRDFFRYTRYGLDHLFTANGFVVQEIRPLGGFWITCGQLFVYYLYRFHRGPLRWVPVIPVMGLVLQTMAAILDRIDRTPQWTWCYLVTARAA